MPTPNYVRLAVEGSASVPEIRLSCPDLLNRFDCQLHEEFISALEQTSRNEELRAIILCAEGRVFSAGGDFDEMLEANHSQEVRNKMERYAREVVRLLTSSRVPVIAGIQGAAIGLGATIAGLADIVVAWRGAKIADTHVKVGLVAGDGGIISWAQSVGINRAKRYLLTGDAISAEQAYAFGLVTDLVDDAADVLPAARAIGAQIESLPADGVNGTRAAFAALTQVSVDAAFELGLALELKSMAAASLPATIARMRSGK